MVWKTRCGGLREELSDRRDGMRVSRIRLKRCCSRWGRLTRSTTANKCRATTMKASQATTLQVL